VQTVAQGREAAEASADVIVAQGTEAGGHGMSEPLFTLLPQVIDACPGTVVVAAGGIADGRGMAAALMLGAQGVLIGTRFYASQEAEGHPEAKRRIVQAQGGDTVRSIVFDLSRRHTETWLGRESELQATVAIAIATAKQPESTRLTDRRSEPAAGYEVHRSEEDRMLNLEHLRQRISNSHVSSVLTVPQRKIS
jgi:hypothetical protein